VGSLARNPVCPYGKRTIVAGGTPQLLFTTSEVPVAAQGIWPVRVSRIYIEALNANTGLIYIGTKGMVVSTGVGVLFSLAAPGGNPIVNGFMLEELAFGANNYRLQDYWIDGTTGEGVLRTVWVA
jgi:hypothetical protein